MPSSREWSLVICSGGSGGHLMPALAVLEELQSRATPPEQVVVLSTVREIEQTVLNSALPDASRVQHVPLDVPEGAHFRRVPFSSSWKLGAAVRTSRRVIRSLSSPVVLGMGGFGSVPGVLAARSLRVPIVLHEQNIVPGRATSWLARLADRICVSFPETSDEFPKGKSMRAKMIDTGNPVRKSIQLLHEQHDEDRVTRSKTLLVLGGSQGSRSINDLMMRFVEQRSDALRDWRIVHQTGSGDVERVRTCYQSHDLDADVQAYFSGMETLYADAQLVISRAGATTLAELACADLFAILVPYPGAVRDHQRKNADWYHERGAAMVVPHPAGLLDVLTFQQATLWDALTELLMNESARKEARGKMRSLARPDAASRVADVVESLVSASCC